EVRLLLEELGRLLFGAPDLLADLFFFRSKRQASSLPENNRTSANGSSGPFAVLGEARGHGVVEDVAVVVVHQDAGQPGTAEARDGDVEPILRRRGQDGLAGPARAHEGAERQRASRIAHAILRES